MNSLEFKIVDMKYIDGSNNKRYFGKINELQFNLLTDGIFQPHLTEQEFIKLMANKYIETHSK
jgi:hypothetical protein